MTCFRRLGAALLGVVLAFALPAQADDRKVTVFAAASLTESVGEIAKAYEAKTGIHVETSFASSSILARQIEQSPGADVFISADNEWMDYLGNRGLIAAETRVAILANHLVLIAPAASGARVKIAPNFDLVGALGGERLAVGDPDAVPAGKYARQALTTLGVWGAVADHLLRGDSVRIAMSYVALGEAPLGIVYSTDALAEPKVRVVDIFADDTHLPIVYPAAVLKGADAEAPAFLSYLQGPEATAVFTKRGFVILGKSAP